MRRILTGFILLLALVGVSGLAGIAAARQANAEQAVATFAGGCFWCTESDFDHVPGVLKTISGYTGGSVRNPSYQQVSSGGTGHAEAVQVTYDPSRVSYAKLLAFYWRSIDPTVRNAQFCDHGTQYRTAIFVSNEAERALAEASKKKVEAELKTPIYTEIDAAGPFYPAEDYHQDFYKKNPT
ncbi:MAG: peptide-methionine (S)-S-oxide reductase, partial [Acidocella sp. 35-58-6]